MIILNLIIADKEQVDAVVSSILKNKFSLNVAVGSALDLFYLNDLPVKTHSLAYPIHFVTKSILFGKIEEAIKKEFPALVFFIYAAPTVHINTIFYDEIKKNVTGISLIDEETEN
ncbi:MAG: hypothetical protein K2X48_19930 [Chitinophagaceae bacterium]|nr:hypothetical protein [Chitinophagaceae bacterium]